METSRLRRLILVSVLASLAGSSPPAFAELTFDVVKSFELSYGGRTLILGSDGALYGTSEDGGDAGAGTVFRIDPAGSFEVLHSFSGTDGRTPLARLVEGRDGFFYGVTGGGSTTGHTIFRVDRAGNFISLHAFRGGESEGENPIAPLVVGSDGALYGTTQSGGSARNAGIIFRIDGAGNFTTLHAFNESDGRWPSEPLVVGSDGALYGTAPAAGYVGDGTLFRIDAAGNFTTLYSFFGAEGATPRAPVRGADGSLYGATGANYDSTGMVFRIDNTGRLTRLHTFDARTDGYDPSALVVGADGAFYGTTNSGGPAGYGGVFRVDAAGHFTNLHAFRPEEGQGHGVVPGSDGALYGITQNVQYGVGGEGILFRIDRAGNFTALHALDPPSEGWDPSPLVVGSDGALYGTTAARNGIVFRVDGEDAFTSLHQFASEGRNPSAALTPGSDGALYGTTTAGGSFNRGTLFRIDAGSRFDVLHAFHLSDGQPPWSVLTLGSDGSLYGTAQAGGASGAGTVFGTDRAGAFTALRSFVGADGAGPATALALGSDGSLFGTTPSGGASGAGTVFRIGAAGTFTSLHAFDPWTEGARPLAALVPGSDGALYGTTQTGGSAAYAGSVFAIDETGSFRVLHRFDGTDGSGPSAALVPGDDGALYGTTPSGGVSAAGTIFRIDDEGAFTSLHSFDAVNGATPSAALVFGSDGALYGTTQFGGASDRGTVFRVDRTGRFASLHSFSGVDGRNPFTALVRGRGGALYGTTRTGGSTDQGTLFQIDCAGRFRSLRSFGGAEGGLPAGALALASDGALYGTLSDYGAARGGGIYRLFEEGPLCQAIRFDPLPDRHPGELPFAVSASASSGLPVSISATGICTIRGDQLSLTGVGACTVTASQSGNAEYEPALDVSQSFRVLFDFSGFLRPVMNPPVVNRVEAGRTIAIRFLLGADQGSDVLAAGSPEVRAVPCPASVSGNEVTGVATRNPDRLLHAPGSPKYTYLWKTDERWAGTCQEFALELADGSVHRALFRFPGRSHGHADPKRH